MIHLITGGSASGKSAYGEQMAVEAKGRLRYYLATMRPWGEEGRARVARHRQQRMGKGFFTMEVYRNLENVMLPGRALETEPGVSGAELWENTVVLLECMSNLVANELFEAGGTDEEIAGRIQRGVRHLQDCAGTVIVVTNEVFSDGCFYEAETMRYIRLLGRMNRELAAMADRVTEVVYGIAISVKPAGDGSR